jgi:quinol monooxygenase YgiN
MHIRVLLTALMLCFSWTAQAQAPAPPAPGSSTSATAGPAPTAFVVTFKIKPGKNEAFESAFREMQASVRANEPGNLYYDLYRPSPDEPQTYVVVEHYRDAAAVQAHGRSDHGKKFFAAMHDLMNGAPKAERLVLVTGSH